MVLNLFGQLHRVTDPALFIEKSLSRDCIQTCLYTLRPLSLIYLQRYKKNLTYANI